MRRSSEPAARGPASAEATIEPPRSTEESLSVSVIVVHYGDGQWLERCLASIELSAGVSTSVVVVDNSSGTNAPLQRHVLDSGGTYLRYPENSGFAAGANTGLRWARLRYGSDVLVVVNSDLRLGRHCLRRLAVRLTTDQSIGVAGPALMTASEPRRYWNVGTSVAWPQGRPRSRYHGVTYRRGQLETVDVDYVCGAVLALRPEVLSRAGFLDEAYYLYYEDAEFSFRVRRAGYRVMVVPAARAWHRGGASLEGLSLRALYYRTRNRLLFSSVCNPCALRGRWSRALFALRALARAARQAAVGRRPLAATLCRAVTDYFFGVRGKSPSQRDLV